MVNVLFYLIVGIIFVVVYAIINVYWVIVQFTFNHTSIRYFKFCIKQRIKIIQKKIVGETTALAGSTTESLRNIELVKSLGLSQQEINRLNNTTEKILKLELKKSKVHKKFEFCSRNICEPTSQWYFIYDALFNLCKRLL